MGSATDRLSRIEQRLSPDPDPTFLAYAREVVRFGGGDPSGPAPGELARWLQSGCRRDPTRYDTPPSAPDDDP